MARLKPAPGIIRFAIRGHYGTDPWANVYHVDAGVTTGYSGADLLAAGETFFGLWTTQFMPAQVTTSHAEACDVKDLSTDTGSVATFIPTSPVAGSSPSGNGLPASCAIVISWREAFSYKGGHPRSYLGAVPVSEVLDPSHITNTFKTFLVSASNAFLTAVFDADWPAAFIATRLVVCHYFRNRLELASPEVQPILSALCDNRIDSQRRRMRA